MFGSHLSIAGSMVNALREGESLGLDCVQVFTKNQQQWKAKALDPGMVREWRAEVARLGWDRAGPALSGAGRGGITSHASYLINLASVSDELWRKSVDLMVDEIERCETLGIPFLVHHPGSFVNSTLDAGLTRIAAAYREVFSRTRGYATVSCLEGTCGAGSQIGGRFEELARLREMIIDATGQESRVGYCLDTCHMHAAGYDLSTREKGEAAIAEFDRLCGVSRLMVLHVNDSKGKAGSHLDRHMHIGAGTIGHSPRKLGASGFAAFMAHPVIRTIPKILETPKETDSRGRAWDAENLRRLRALVPTTPGATKRPVGVRPARRKAASKAR